MTIVVIAGLAIILYISREVSSNQFLYITATTTDNLDALSLQNILGALTHIAGEHDHYAHLSQNRGDTALASASFR